MLLRNNMFTSTIMKDFPLHFENSIYVPNFTDWMSGICEAMFTSLGVVSYLHFNLRDLKFFRFLKNVSINLQRWFEEFVIILLQRSKTVKSWENLYMIGKKSSIFLHSGKKYLKNLLD